MKGNPIANSSEESEKYVETVQKKVAIAERLAVYAVNLKTEILKLSLTDSPVVKI